MAHEDVNLGQTIQAREITYGEWYQDRLPTVTLEMAARTLSVSIPALLTSFGLCWHLDVVTDEFSLNQEQVRKLTDTSKRKTIDEVLALALALGPTKIEAGPLAIVVDLVTAGGVLEFYTCLVLAQGKLSSPIGFGEVLLMQNEHNYTDHLFKMRASVQHWLYSSLNYAFGLFVGVDQARSQHHPDTQLPGENAGFPMSQQQCSQCWDLTMVEVEDLVPVIALVLIPIFGPMGLLRYPAKPVSMAVHVATVSIFTYLQDSPPMEYEHVVKELLSGDVPQVYTTIKTEQRAEEKMMGVIRARTRKATVLTRSTAPSIGTMLRLTCTDNPFDSPGLRKSFEN